MQATEMRVDTHDVSATILTAFGNGLLRSGYRCAPPTVGPRFWEIGNVGDFYLLDLEATLC